MKIPVVDQNRMPMMAMRYPLDVRVMFAIIKLSLYLRDIEFRSNSYTICLINFTDLGTLAYLGVNNAKKIKHTNASYHSGNAVGCEPGRGVGAGANAHYRQGITLPIRALFPGGSVFPACRRQRQRCGEWFGDHSKPAFL